MFSTLIDTPTLLTHYANPDWVIIDCRFALADTEGGRRAYQEAHIPGAYYAHLDEDLSGPIVPGKTGRHPIPSIYQLVQRFSQWGVESHKQVVVYDDKGGAIASRLWWLLRWLGHEKVAVLDGGWQAWLAELGPTSDEVPAYQEDVQFEPDANPYWLVNATFVEQARDDEQYLVVDSRAAERYSGAHEPIDPVSGHVPWALNAPFAENWSKDFHFKTMKELEERFQALLGEHPVEDTVFYCGSGVTACHNILALAHAGLGMAKLYGGSWSDWITDSNRPIATTPE
ncbi:MAG: sulfurtransferase [Bacteroidota bacterium]